MKKVLRWFIPVGLALALVGVAVGSDIYHDSTIGRSSAPTGKTSGGPGTSFNMRPVSTFDTTGVELTAGNVFNSALFIFDIGVFADSSNSGKWTFSIEDSANDTTYASVSEDLLSGTCPTLVDSADGAQAYTVLYRGYAQYVRPNWTVTAAPESAAVACPFSILVMRLDPLYSPVR